MKKAQIPQTMRALVLEEFGGTPVVKTVEVPKPGKGQALVKIDSSPVNPSDYSFIRGLYSTAKKTPVIPGFEASGTIVATGSDLLSRRLRGKKVACFAPTDGNGSWAEYMLTSNKMVIPLKQGIDLEQGSMLMVNPITVMAMVDIAKKGNHVAIANTAAASALGQFLVTVCKDANLPLVNIVRRKEQADLLQKLGAEHIVISDAPGFAGDLKALFSQLRVTLAFDAVSGQTTFDLMEALPPFGEVMVYGGLSEQPALAHPGKLIFEHKKLSGLWVSPWIARQPLHKMLWLIHKIQQYARDKHQTAIQQRISLEQVADMLKTYRTNMTAGKILVKPGL